MKLNQTPRINADPMLVRELREHAQQVNQMSEGRIAAAYNASTSAPVAGSYAQGDFVRNKTPAELGTAGSKYVVAGWLHDGAAFLECRYLTGN